jgi:cupin fold WbuC family metalloprotein
MDMEKIYSRVSPGKLLHLVFRLDEARGRTNIAPDSEFLQVASIKMRKGQTFEAHKHIIHEKTTNITQESWLVIKGQVECILYDLDDTIIARHVLNPGDGSMTFRGGHNYVILEDDTVVYEYKTGPYLGQQLDKTFLKTQSETGT